MTDAEGTSPLVTTGPAGYGPADLQSAYALPSSTAGSGQTIAIVDAYDDPAAESDLATYRAQYGLPSCTTANGCLRKVDQSGATQYPAPDTGWAQEISLDLDVVSAACPNCKILLVEAASNSFSNLGTAVDYAAAHAGYVSNSYGGSEFTSETSSTYAAHYIHPGIAITVSSGDNGYGVEFPAASPTVTAVGGTTLNRSSATRGWSETTWSGAGSGCSAYVTKPSFQRDSGCAKRTVADVSAVADPNTGVAVYDSYNSGGWLVFGGTSAAAPLVAGAYALAGAPAGTDWAAYPYAHAGSYNDVTSGSNGTCTVAYLCTAAVGYDGPTGLGTPAVGTASPPPASQPPTVSTAAATAVSATAATLGGSVNPNGLATTYHFDYGTSTSYGSRSPAADASAGSATTAQTVSTSLTGLTPSTTYHYRLVAASSAATTTGADATFTTAAAPPPASTTTVFPGATTLLSGTVRSGSLSNLQAIDGSTLQINAKTKSPYATDYYGRHSAIPNTATALTIDYAGANSIACPQTISVYNATQAGWQAIDTRTVGTSQTRITVTLGGTPADYVSNTTGSGDVLVRVQCTGTSSNRYTISDLMSVGYST